MKTTITYILFIVTVFQGFGQKIETDIFNDLKYESREGNYQASLKKNIFDDLIFSDNKNNTITLQKKYIELKYGKTLLDFTAKSDLFISFIHEFRHERDYQATYSVDILGKIIFEDNRHKKIEIGKDIFGHETYNEENNGRSSSITRNLSGTLEYRSGFEKATLQKDILDKWNYSDSCGNEFKISSVTWNKLKDKFGSEENIFSFLIEEFLVN